MYGDNIPGLSICVSVALLPFVGRVVSIFLLQMKCKYSVLTYGQYLRAVYDGARVLYTYSPTYEDFGT